MADIEQNISNLIELHFPEFYREEGETFVAFVKAYYEWLELNSYIVDGVNVAPGTLYYARNLHNIRDIDRTTEEFIIYFKEKYLAGINFDTVTDTKNFIKHSLELYRSKGTSRSIDLLFSLLYNEKVNVYLPGDDILKPSDGVWFKPVYLELDINDKSKGFIGQTVVGASSSATGLVEGFSRRNIRGRIVDLLFLSNVVGNFTTGELIGTGVVEADNPRVIGSLTNIVVNTRGQGFGIGDILDVTSNISGTQGKARVTSTGTATGLVDYRLIDGGYGYSTNAEVIISEKVLTKSSFNSVNTYVEDFGQLESIKQILANVEIQSPQGDLLDSNTLVLGTNTTAIVSAGYVVEGNTTATTKYLVIEEHIVANAAIDTISNPSTNGSFDDGEAVYQISDITGSNSFVGFVVSANSTYVLIDSQIGELVDDEVLYGAVSECEANVNSIVLYNGSFSDADDIETSIDPATGNCIIDTVNDITASGLIVGTSNLGIGVYNIANSFKVPNTYSKALVQNDSRTKTANISAVSTGNPGSFSIGSITDTESVFLNTDFIGGNNSSNVPYLSVRIDASNSGVGFIDSITVNNGGTLYSNSDVVVFTGGTPTVSAAATINTHSNGTIESITVDTPGSGYDSKPAISITTSTGSGANLTVNADFGYGFPKLPDADLTTIITLALTRETKTIGTIASINEIDPGADNTASPFNLVIEKSIAGFGRKNYYITLEDVEGSYLVGEDVTQIISAPAVTLQVSNANTFNIGELIEQTRSDSVVVYGEIVSRNLTGSSGTLFLSVANSANTFDTTNNIIGLETLNTADVDGVIANNIVESSKGEILTITTSGDQVILGVKRKRFAVSFNSGIELTGSFSGATGNVVSLTEIGNSPVLGNNAIVSSVAGVANGTITGLEVVDSGYAYRENELVTLQNDTNEFVGTGFVRLEQQGVGEGYYESQRGFLSSNKYIQDSNYYQEYSFEVQAGISLNKYTSILKDLIQVAGTKLFGAVVKFSSINVPITASLTVDIEEREDLLSSSGTEDLMTASGYLDLQSGEESSNTVFDLALLSGTEDLSSELGVDDLEQIQS